MNTQQLLYTLLVGFIQDIPTYICLTPFIYQWREWYNVTIVSLFYVKEDWLKPSDISYHIFRKIDVNHPTIPTAFSC